MARVITPKAGDPPPLSPQQLHPAFLNGGTIQQPQQQQPPTALLHQQVQPPPQVAGSTPGSVPVSMTTTKAPVPPSGSGGVNIAMVPYMIPLQQMQQLYSQAQQPQQQVVVNVPSSPAAAVEVSK